MFLATAKRKEFGGARQRKVGAMSDAVHTDNDLVSSPTFQLAYLATVLSGKEVTESAILNHMEKIKDCSSDKSILARASSAARFKATITDVSFEESSQRYVISFKSSPDGKVEQIRTDRVDGRYGDYVRRTWSDGEKKIGRSAIFYKHREAAGESRDVPQGYRNLPFIKFL